MPADTANDDATGRRAYAAPALEKGLDILELLATAEEPLSTRAIAERLGRSKAEIFRMVFVLVERGYLARDEADRLHLTNRLFELGMRTPRPRELAEVAVPLMERLSEDIGQSAHLVVVNRGETVVIATTTGGSDISFTLRLGYRRPAFDATSGLIVLAYQPAGALERMIAEAGGSVSVPALHSTLSAIRDKGYHVSESHDVVGVTDIGCAVLGPGGRAVASIVVPHLSRHGAEPNIDAIVEALRVTCAEITAQLT